MRLKFLTAEEAVKIIKSGSTVATGGFVGNCVPEELEMELEKRYLQTEEPKNLTLVYVAGQGDGKDRGINHFGYEGMIKRVIGGHWGLAPKVQKLALENKIEGYTFPQGVIAHLFRDIAAGKPGTITHVGLKTFVDPRIEGGKLNKKTKEDLVEVIDLYGKEYLFYKAFPIDFALLRGTYADERGNVTMEKEVGSLEVLSIAQACKNSGGKVIVQVEKVVKAGTLDPRLVKIPGIYVDTVVEVQDMKNHMQTFSEQYNPGYTGNIKVPVSSVKPMELDERKIIARRAVMELVPNAIVNLGIGMPEGVSIVANEEGVSDQMILTVEPGPIGGIPVGGLSFGATINPEAIIDQPNQFDFYDGGGLDVAFLGLAECDEFGNINVSKFGPKITGPGGFINITQNAKKVVFCGTFTAGGLKIEAANGKLSILQEGKVVKFIGKVEQITFSGKYAEEVGQTVIYITERAVFELGEDGLVLTEIAPGIELVKDVLEYMDFKPVISKNLKLMDERIFKSEKMGVQIEQKFPSEALEVSLVEAH
ncbi:propionate CoA-transferase [Anaerovirgula multivorans]|uniref:Propionate CoA-transferase n=1 Tax=Anaerovirgula multivorans TaxID=312168 RepID=A0A239HL50_9FIRM|nr:acyl CoA:acetate/3-ketoacid CoA transferase [Anaerovirgula multivorans]SNS82067.1 propionate CoA-transferase [Anaerovirgula multivorans]